MNESEYTRKKIVPRITRRGGVVTKKAAGPRQPVGMPDLLGCYLGFCLALEVKKPENTSGLTEKQRATLHKWEMAGAYTGEVRFPFQVDDLLDYIENAARGS